MEGILPGYRPVKQWQFAVVVLTGHLGGIPTADGMAKVDDALDWPARGSTIWTEKCIEAPGGILRSLIIQWLLRG